MHLFMKIICFSNDPLTVDTWTTFMWILCQCALSLYINTKIKFSLNISYFQEAGAVPHLFWFWFSLSQSCALFQKGKYLGLVWGCINLKLLCAQLLYLVEKHKKNQQAPIQIFKLIDFRPFGVPFLKIQRFRKQQCYKNILLRVLIVVWSVHGRYVCKHMSELLKHSCKQGTKMSSISLVHCR